MTNKRKSDNRMRDVFDSNLWVFSEAMKQGKPLLAISELEKVMTKKLGTQVIVGIENMTLGLKLEVRDESGVHEAFETEIDDPRI